MSPRSRASAREAGTKFETAQVDWLAARLDDDRIERRAKNGTKDRGDIGAVRTVNGTKVVIECKNVTKLALAGWIAEAEVERGNDDAGVAVVMHKRHGNGKPAEQYVTMTAENFARLLEGGVYERHIVVADPHTIRGEL